MKTCSSCIETKRRVEEIKTIANYCITNLQILLERFDSTPPDEEGEDGEDEDEEGDDEADDSTARLGRRQCSRLQLYNCPEVDCSSRKSDESFKQYSRHYEIRNISTRPQAPKLANVKVDVKCSVSCFACSQELKAVSLLKRHVRTCQQLKEKQSMPGHKDAASRMKEQVKKESQKASDKALASLSKPRRQLGPNNDSSISRKRARSPALPNPTHPTKKYAKTSKRMPPLGQTGHDRPITADILNHALPALSESERNLRTDEVVANAQHPTMGLSIPKSYLTNVRHFPTETHSQSMFGDDQCAAEQGTTALGGLSPSVDTMDRSFADAEHIVDRNATDFSPDFVMDAMEGSFTNARYIAERNTTTLRGSSFFTNTMDGSFADVQHLEEQNASVLRGPSFLTNTMDGSFYR